MAKRRSAGAQITERDLALFEYLFINRIAMAEQINRDIFHVSDVRDVRKRLRLLLQRDYLRRGSIDGAKPKFTFNLSDSTFQQYLANRVQRPWAQLKSDAPVHDVTLVDIKARFLQSKKVAAYLTENAIESELDCPAEFPVQTFLEMHSDGAIVFKPAGEEFYIAIEYENSQQRRSRYEEHFASYYVRDEIHGVIYITKEPSLRTHLAEIEKEISHHHRPKIFFGDLADVLNPRASLHFLNNRRETLRVD